MTDSQAINSSDCAWMCDKLEATQRKLGAITFGSHGSEISYLKLQAVLASHDLIYRLSQLQERLAKLEGSRALVAEQEQASVDTSPQFAVGDTVKITGASLLNQGVGENGTITGVELTPEPEDSKVPYARVETNDAFWSVALTDLTLIRKANA